MGNKLSIRMLENNRNKPISLTLYRLDGRTELMQGSYLLSPSLIGPGRMLCVDDGPMHYCIKLNKFSIPFVDSTGEHMKVTLQEVPDAY